MQLKTISHENQCRFQIITSKIILVKSSLQQEASQQEEEEDDEKKRTNTEENIETTIQFPNTKQ